MTRVALITGAAGGIGFATVTAFTEAGWRVLAVDRDKRDDYPPGASAHRIDLANPQAISDFFGQLELTETGLHALVNNAAVGLDKPLVETTLVEWDAVMATNLRAAYATAKGAWQLLQAVEGAVVNVSSVHALATSVNVAAYAAAKGGLLALTRAMALEFAAGGVRANAVVPGAVDTAMLQAGLDRRSDVGPAQDALAVLRDRTPLGRVGKPDEIARAILFLADSEQSSFITGQSLVVDGGATARLATE